jgi:hypothetical protein
MFLGHTLGDSFHKLIWSPWIAAPSFENATVGPIRWTGLQTYKCIFPFSSYRTAAFCTCTTGCSLCNSKDTRISLHRPLAWPDSQCWKKSKSELKNREVLYARSVCLQNHFLFRLFAANQGCQIFLEQHTKTGENVPNDYKINQIASK